MTHSSKKSVEIYCSTDVETNGPVPGQNSMLSFGTVAFIIDDNKAEQIGKFYHNLELLPGAVADPDTTEFWKQNPEAYAFTQADQQNPQQAMKQYHNWLTNLPGLPVFVGYPAAFDFMWIYYYLMRFVGSSPYSFSALDIKTYGMSMMKTNYRKSTKNRMPKRWFAKNLPHTHHALDDAIEQGWLFCNMFIENNQIKT